MTTPQRWMAIAWPAFLLAGLVEVLVFAFVDPAGLQWHGQLLEWSREAVYSVSFFVFWLATGLSSFLTSLLLKQPDEVNQA